MSELITAQQFSFWESEGKKCSPTFYVGFIKWGWISQDRILGYGINAKMRIADNG
ncbi:hypothetical protein HY792_07630 [Candidatus Desantisbacteria bacterium]|nr:hypothetical protein [Candidatus Desantisbacteria bacterium]